MTFFRGQMVVFIGDGNSFESIEEVIFPSTGDTLVINQTYEVDAMLDGGRMLSLVGIYAPADEFWLEGFRVECFRPAVDRKTDISVFKKALPPCDVRIREDA